jgi:hypothetical protein
MTRWALIAICAIFSPAQELQDITGNWVGTLARSILPGSSAGSTGRSKQVVVNLSKDRHGQLRGLMYDGTLNATTFPFVSVSLVGPRLTFTIMPPFGSRAMSFVGTLSNDGNWIDGQFQGEPLKLERAVHTHNSISPEVNTPSPEATSSTSPSAPADSDAMLKRALEKLAGTTRRLLKYTCLETIERTYYTEPRKKPAADPMTEAPANACDGKHFNMNHMTVDAEDRLRLEVAVADGSEIHSWAAANRFDSRSVFQMVSTGPISTGAFGTWLVDVFEGAGTQYEFAGRKIEGSHDVFEYSFEKPKTASQYSVRKGNGWDITGYHGSFEIYAASAELARLIIETDQLSPETQMCRARTAIDYHYVQIGNGQFLVPSKSAFDTLSPNANETRSVTTFSACHEYAAESSLVLDDETSTAAAKVAAKTAAPLPPGLSLTLALLAPIDTRSAAAGDAVSAKVTKAVRAPGSDEILVAAGAVVHGRIVQMRHQYSTAQYLISIRYDTLEQKGAVSPLSIELDRELKLEKARTKNGFANRGVEFSLPPPAASGESGSWFAIPAGMGGYVMPASSESKWITLAK